VGPAHRPRGPGREPGVAHRAAALRLPDEDALSAPPVPELAPPPEAEPSIVADTVDGVAVARLYGEPLFTLPTDLYIPPDALEVFLEAFEGPLDLLLYLIRKQNVNVLDIPMAELTRQYLGYVEMMRRTQLELAAEYLLMAAVLIEIKSCRVRPRSQAPRPRIHVPSSCAGCSSTNG